MIRRRRLTPLLLALLLLAACSDATGPAASIEGAWTLEAVDDVALPAPPGAGAIVAGSLDVTGDAFLLRLDMPPIDIALRGSVRHTGGDAFALESPAETFAARLRGGDALEVRLGVTLLRFRRGAP